mmetsp:Transcript_21182/g.29142  ORF Transcript_21182/g.29142 Transcript_21182/m.29142 type:complete len:267 (+) Transcript_21182:23-823(+)|eukprot:CAMPEP_0170075486 /NCGR_PEP_ID=MMETSP0019_2-20121128/12621_1 /TAXON_ID=98059 /ORGANISM="Dinobryon sp., Strain UTEXLB2267" /LENGTH=266 /DNA_ID=CAMNT_0010286499 /DNA_START=18 /DNA_END=818 /DNA_ORIENTATION=-
MPKLRRKKPKHLESDSILGDVDKLDTRLDSTEIQREGDSSLTNNDGSLLTKKSIRKNSQVRQSNDGNEGTDHSYPPSNSDMTENSGADDDKFWVQCNICEKWRSLPSHIDLNTLPEVWSCELNVTDPLRMVCSAPEEDYRPAENEKHLPLKSFLKLWMKRLQNADRAEHKISTGSVTRGKKRRSDVEWIQCCNPSCGKWRSIARFVDSDALLSRLSNGRSSSSTKSFLTHSDEWFCSMNFWDDSTASCAAPQEALWSCRWNLTEGV